MKKAALACSLVGTLASLVVSLQAQPAPAAAQLYIPYAAARAVLDTLRPELLPQELRTPTAEEREALWPSWVLRRDGEIRRRLERGDEDSIVTLLLFGVSFTTQPRYSFAARASMPAASPPSIDAVVQAPVVRARIADMVRGITAPGTNERLQFARRVIERAGIDLTSLEGPREARALLDAALGRMLVEYDAFFADGTLASTRFRDRGLSSDTSIPAAYAIDRALADLQAKGLVAPNSVARVAVVGPGLDFADKQEGLDIYPVQTIQPFAVLDSLMRLGLAAAGGARLVTMDINPRVTQHLESATDLARRGVPYVIQLPRDASLPWSPGLAAYWDRFGERIGRPVAPVPPPAAAGAVRLRAVEVRPAVIQAVAPSDLDIVLQRPSPMSDDDRFDLVVATNVLVYYDVFEQSLALANIASLLRPGGVLLTNTPLFPLPAIPMALAGETRVDVTTTAADWVQWYVRE